MPAEETAPVFRIPQVIYGTERPEATGRTVSLSELRKASSFLEGGNPPREAPQTAGKELPKRQGALYLRQTQRALLEISTP